MTIDIKELLKGAEVGTMRKDIQELKKLKAVKKPTKINILDKERISEKKSQQIISKIPLAQAKAEPADPEQKTETRKPKIEENIVLEKERPYLKEVPPIVKEKLQNTAEVEEEQRKKFMEDVEKWASSSQDSDNK